MKLNIAICDDLKVAQLQLASFIWAYCAERSLEVSVKLFSSGEELLDAFRPGMFHILFLDIYMNELDGVQTARIIRKTDQTCTIIFATTSEDHGLVSYEVQASDYLVKPIKQEDLNSAMDWCMEQIRSTYRMLTVACETGAVTLPLRDIMYIEIQGHTACLHAADGGGVLTTRRGLDELEQEIRHPDFIRCHRSFLANMNHVQWLEKNAFLLYNGESVPIGSTMAASVKEKFLDWSFIKAFSKLYLQETTDAQLKSADAGDQCMLFLLLYSSLAISTMYLLKGLSLSLPIFFCNFSSLFLYFSSYFFFFAS